MGLLPQLLGHKPSKVLIVGASGTGKTTYFLRYLANVPARWRFVYDHEGELAGRLGVPPAHHPEEMAGALIRSGWCIYDPVEMFEGNLADGWAAFCGWAFEMSKRLPGRKLLCCDELQKLIGTNAADLPRELATALETGRRHGLDCAFAAQQPNLLHNRLRTQLTEIVCFNLPDERAIEWVEKAGINADEIRELHDGEWAARNLRTGGTAAGCVF